MALSLCFIFARGAD
jgi:hypothetical protein